MSLGLSKESTGHLDIIEMQLKDDENYAALALLKKDKLEWESLLKEREDQK